ncbi:hypothetical protein WJX77_011110 [Trebouxia sp. C0004]
MDITRSVLKLLTQHQPRAMSLPSSQSVRDTPASQPRSAIARFQAERLANLSRVAARASSRLAGPSGVSPQGSGNQMSDARPATTPAA